ncbi:MAG TPA: flagellar biosynthesis repressor FlbT [Dongiaceae bacterium]|nr:flagellar biosynthesis repressor FlbT [Dongiaceae bacterium]
MPLKFSLRPGEKVIVNGAVIGRGEEPGTFYLYNKVNFLRGREVMKEEQADTNEKKLYLAIQLLYLFPEDTAETSTKFETVLAHCRADRPDRAQDLDQVAQFVQERDYYRALKLTAKLF